jgi:fructooligosaccharide transport system permease protein
MVQPMIMVGNESKNVLTISYYIYSLGYTNRDVGRSSALALVMTIIIGAITFLQRKFLGEKED